MTEAEGQALDLEELAAYIDGRLDGARKARMAEHIARDPDAYELFVASVEAVEDEEHYVDTEIGYRVVEPTSAWQRFPIRYRVAAALAAAAAIAGIVVGARLLLPETDSAEALVALIERNRLNRLPLQDDPETGLPWHDPRWSRVRGGEPINLEQAEAAFRLGVRSVDLRIAAAIGDAEAWPQVLAQTSTVADGADFFVMSAMVDQLDLADREIVIRLREVDEGLDDTLSAEPLARRRLMLGRWAETGRLAAMARDAAALQDRRYSRARKRLDLDDPARTAVEAELATIDQLRHRKPPDFEALVVAYERLIHRLAG